MATLPRRSSSSRMRSATRLSEGSLDVPSLTRLRRLVRALRRESSLGRSTLFTPARVASGRLLLLLGLGAVGAGFVCGLVLGRVGSARSGGAFGGLRRAVGRALGAPVTTPRAPAGALAVVGRVEARALEMDGHRVQD